MRLGKNSLSFIYWRQWRYFKGLDYFKITKTEYRTCAHYGFMFIGISIANSLEKDLEQLYLDGYKKGRADEREWWIKIVESIETNSKAPGFNNGWDHCKQRIIKAIKAE